MRMLCMPLGVGVAGRGRHVIRGCKGSNKKSSIKRVVPDMNM